MLVGEGNSMRVTKKAGAFALLLDVIDITFLSTPLFTIIY
jgi:hypothetical protein